MHRGVELFWRYWPLTAALATGCLSEKRFSEQYTNEVCSLLDDCAILTVHGYSTARQCRADADAVYEGCENFSSGDARQCLSDLAARSCDAAMEIVTPRSCARVCEASD